MKSGNSSQKQRAFDEDEAEFDGEGEVGDTMNQGKMRIAASQNSHLSLSSQVDKKEPRFQCMSNMSNSTGPQLGALQREMCNNFPGRITQEIPDSKIVFSSNFCSGNLSAVKRGLQKNQFDLYVAADGAPYAEGDYYRTWWYFSVTGVTQGEQLSFTFRNLGNQNKLYNQGLKPAFRVLPTHQAKWRRTPSKLSWYYNNEDQQFTLSFSHVFTFPSTQTAFFAFTFPFSYQETLEHADKMEQRLMGVPNTYFCRETLFYSLEGRKMELLTISSEDSMTEERETIPKGESKGMFPYTKDRPGRQRDCKRFHKEKPVIFLTSRVHPGETAGSFALNGLLDLITDVKNEQGRMLRQNYVFKVIPVLNPDGVSRGYYRLDTNAQNLNRYYLEPKKYEQPTIWAAKKAVVQQAEEYDALKMYIDFHAHASKKGGFMFGNHLENPEQQADCITFAKLVAMNCLNFDMNECNFSDKIMTVKDRSGLSREGSSRVALYKATGSIYCYTLEFNYHSGKRINTLAPKYIRSTGNVEPETTVSDPSSKIYSNCSSPAFTPEIFEDCGRAIGAALLDLIDNNPVSRIPMSCYRSVSNVRTDIMTNLEKYASGQPNVVGANHFAPTNQKVAKAFANANGASNKIRPHALLANDGSAFPRGGKFGQNGSDNKAGAMSTSMASVPLGSKKAQKGTFGVAKRLATNEEKVAKPAKRSNGTASTSATKDLVTSQTTSTQATQMSMQQPQGQLQGTQSSLRTRMQGTKQIQNQQHQHHQQQASITSPQWVLSHSTQPMDQEGKLSQAQHAQNTAKQYAALQVISVAQQQALAVHQLQNNGYLSNAGQIIGHQLQSQNRGPGQTHQQYLPDTTLGGQTTIMLDEMSRRSEAAVHQQQVASKQVVASPRPNIQQQQPRIVTQFIMDGSSRAAAHPPSEYSSYFQHADIADQIYIQRPQQEEQKGSTAKHYAIALQVKQKKCPVQNSQQLVHYSGEDRSGAAPFKEVGAPEQCLGKGVRSRSSNLRGKADRHDKMQDEQKVSGKKSRHMITVQAENGDHSKSGPAVNSAAGSRSCKVDKGSANAPRKRYSSSNGNKGGNGSNSATQNKREKKARIQPENASMSQYIAAHKEATEMQQEIVRQNGRLGSREHAPKKGQHPHQPAIMMDWQKNNELPAINPLPRLHHAPSVVVNGSSVYHPNQVQSQLKTSSSKNQNQQALTAMGEQSTDVIHHRGLGNSHKKQQQQPGVQEVAMAYDNTNQNNQVVSSNPQIYNQNIRQGQAPQRNMPKRFKQQK